jgi:RsiW-degrading membrane proteinase PrsW (M82 family)
MMRTVCVLALLLGASALQKPGYGDMLRMTLKSRTVSEVTMDMEDPGDEEHLVTDSSREGTSKTTDEEMHAAKGAFAGFVILTAGVSVGVYLLQKSPLAVTVEHEDVERYERGALFYNKVAPAVLITMAFFMFCSVIGGVLQWNTKVDRMVPKTNMPGYEGQSVAHDRIENPGERAFFASFGLMLQAVLGTMVCLYLRKAQEVQISTSMIMKMACRGAVAGALCTMLVEFIRLPFHDYMGEANDVNRLFSVLFWVGFMVLLEESTKIGSIALGLKRSEDDQEALSGPQLTHFIAESAQALAICGLAAGMGFAFVENIPRFYATALEQPLIEVSGQSANALISESTLRSVRVWTFFFWGVLNLQPWLTGIAAMQLANLKAPISPLGWATVLKFVCVLHFVFDLLDRSTSPLVEFMGCCVIPYAMYTFHKQWKLQAAPAGGLLEEEAAPAAGLLDDR